MVAPEPFDSSRSVPRWVWHSTLRAIRRALARGDFDRYTDRDRWHVSRKMSIYGLTQDVTARSEHRSFNEILKVCYSQVATEKEALLCDRIRAYCGLPPVERMLSSGTPFLKWLKEEKP